MAGFKTFIGLTGLFYIGGTAGWVLELFFRRFFSQKRWVNPGFLTGPFLPLYGFGVVGFYIFANFIPFSSLTFPSWGSTLLCVFSAGIGMTVIEYVAGLIFIKGLKVKLWDYSKRPGNIQGVICPLFSFFWLVIGAFYVYLLNPAFVAVFDFFFDHFAIFGFVFGLLYGILFVDFGWSLGLLTKIRKLVSDSRLVVSWENIKTSFQDHYARLEEKSPWIFAFKTKKEEFSALLNEYLFALKEKSALRVEEERHKAKLRKQKRKKD